MPDLTQQMATPTALREWCRVTCTYYPNVEIKNMSTSFRDGLAFCAIIHKHRPDLIDFSSLTKDNVYHNNKLAFEIAQTKLGIPALLDPNDMVSTKVPDCLSVITYLFQYYYFFNRKSYAGLASSKSSQVTALNNLAKSKTPDGLKPWKSSTDLETSREDRLSNTKPRKVCKLCFKPIHLIQRHLIDGKVYHRSCFRCKVCQSTLLPGSYTQGSDASSLICTHHITESQSACVDLSQQIGSTENRPKSETVEKERQERSREVKDGKNRDYTVGVRSMVKTPPHLPAPTVKERKEIEGVAKAGPATIVADRQIQQEAKKTEGSSRPVPAPRRMLDSSAVAVPAPRTKTSQTADNSSNQNKRSLNSSHITSPTSVSPKVKTNHPWLTIIHPGPWTQLPPAQAPRSKSDSKVQGSWYRPRLPPPNPFKEDQEEGTKPDPADQTKRSVAGNDGNLADQSGHAATAVCSSDAEQTAGFKEAGGVAVPVPAEGVGAVTNAVGALSEPVGHTSQIGVSDLAETGSFLSDVTEAAAGPHATSDEAQGHILPRSRSVPAICATFAKCDLTDANESDQFTSCQSKLACKENPFDRNPAMPNSKTFQSLPSRQAAAHGFPLIKRKVQTEQNVSTEDPQVEMRELDEHLEVLEQRGVEQERNLRDCKNDEEEEQMLMEWFSLNHERHVLMCSYTELVYLTKQQKLEERQADVEYEMRCLLNKPESDWSKEDRGREQQLMAELITIVEQRNQIISSLDEDRQREREEDMFLEGMMKNKELQKEGLKELKKSKGKFKLLNHKAESTKDSVDKKS